MNKKERNYYIDFLKFCFSLIIVLYHSWVFTGVYGNGIFNRGAYAVDFYFIVSGFLFISSIEKMKRTKYKKTPLGLLNLKFLWKRVKPLLPSMIFVFAVGYLLCRRGDLLNYHVAFSDSIQSEFFLLGFLGKGMSINSGAWYLSVMFLLFFILFPIAYKFKKNFNYYISPLIVIFCLGIVNYKNILIMDPYSSSFIFIDVFYKGLIFLNLGVLSYEISLVLGKLKLDKLKRVGITIIETLIYLFCLLNMHYAICGSYFNAIMFILGVAITFSGQSYMKELFKSKFFEMMGKFGFLLYLCNIPIRTFMLNNFNYGYHKMLFMYLILTVLFAGVCYIFTELILVKFNKKEVKEK